MVDLNLMRFGKYKGQPLEVVARDRRYTAWLLLQDWFRRQYTGISKKLSALREVERNRPKVRAAAKRAAATRWWEAQIDLQEVA